MALVLIEDTTLTSLATAIRTKGKTNNTLTPSAMPNAIKNISVEVTITVDGQKFDDQLDLISIGDGTYYRKG